MAQQTLGRILQNQRTLERSLMVYKMVHAGWTHEQVSQALGVAPGSVANYVKRVVVLGGEPIARRSSLDLHAKAQEFGDLYASGLTLQGIGDQYGITRERVRQILGRLPEKITRPTQSNQRGRTPDESLELWKAKWKARLLQCKADGCWIWDGPKFAPNKRYPNNFIPKVAAQFRKGEYDLKFNYPYRLSYFLFVGPIPDLLTIDHLCHNPMCINPDHLRVCTLKENSSRHSGDWHEKVRTGTRKRWERISPGYEERNAQIIARYKNGETARSLAVAFDINVSTVAGIVYRAGVNRKGEAA